MLADVFEPESAPLPWLRSPPPRKISTPPKPSTSASARSSPSAPSPSCSAATSACTAAPSKSPKASSPTSAAPRVQHPARRERLHRLRRRPRAQRPPPHRGIPVLRLRHRGRHADRAQRRHRPLPLRRRRPDRPPASPRRRPHLRLVPPQDTAILSSDARPQGALPEHAARRLQRPPRRRTKTTTPSSSSSTRPSIAAAKPPVAWDTNYRDILVTSKSSAPATTPRSSPTAYMVLPRRGSLPTTSPPNTRSPSIPFDLRALAPLRLERDRSLPPTHRPPHRPSTKAAAPTASAPNWWPASPRNTSSLKAAPLRIASLDLPRLCPRTRTSPPPYQRQNHRAHRGVDGVRPLLRISRWRSPHFRKSY